MENSLNGQKRDSKSINTEKKNSINKAYQRNRIRNKSKRMRMRTENFKEIEYAQRSSNKARIAYRQN